MCIRLPVHTKMLRPWHRPPTQVRRTHGGVTGKVLYDIDFDDGDKEEGVLAGRVRSPGQTPPALQAGLVVDVKLARKGKVTAAQNVGAPNIVCTFIL